MIFRKLHKIHRLFEAVSYVLWNRFGNKLTKVDELGENSTGFKDVSGTDYTYDINGNMITDGNKGITNITYNHLNLPTNVSFGGQQSSIAYVYDATGVKQKKTVAGSGIPSKTTEYAGNYIYEDNVLQFFNHAEGYVKTESGKFDYVYQPACRRHGTKII